MTLKEVEKALSSEQSMHEFKKRHGLLDEDEKKETPEPALMSRETIPREEIDSVEDIPLWQQELMRTR